MAYISNYNFRRIFYERYDKNSIFSGEIWLEEKLDILNPEEENRLRAYKAFCEDPERFVKQFALKHKDTYTLLTEQPPCYHDDAECEALNSKYRNVSLPIPIIKEANMQDKNGIPKNENIANIYRSFYKSYSNRDTLELNIPIEEFVEKWNDKRGSLVRLSVDDFKDMKKEEAENSGHTSIINETLEELRDKVNEKIRWIHKNYRDSNDENLRCVFKVYIKRTYLAIRKYRRGDWNETSLSDKELVTHLEILHNEKNDIINGIYDYYHNKSGLELNKTWLETLGFRPCRLCCSPVTTVFNSVHTKLNESQQIKRMTVLEFLDGVGAKPYATTKCYEGTTRQIVFLSLSAPIQGQTCLVCSRNVAEELAAADNPKAYLGQCDVIYSDVTKSWGIVRHQTAQEQTTWGF